MLITERISREHGLGRPLFLDGDQWLGRPGVGQYLRRSPSAEVLWRTSVISIPIE